jgi:universal stress protein E
MKFTRLLCVIDPTTNNQRALNRAAFIAPQSNATVHALLCFAPPQGVQAADNAELEAAERLRHELWLDRLLEPLREQGCTVTTELRPAADWRSEMTRAIRASDADLVIKASNSRTALQRRLMKTSDWLVLREAPCPVLFVKRDDPAEIQRVLAAVNMRDKDPVHVALTDRVIAEAREITEQLGAELHAVSAYRESVNFVHPPDLARRVGIERARAHVGDDDAEQLITDVAARLDASLVIIGSVGRKGMAAAVVGNTAERILDTVQADILSIVQTA